ncbi:interleukin-9 receptor-like isoform X2 [Hemicordylus capensis]|uniref:interleukin-9 receptor-like isoform X2 n=1 Tax=Hemicordylus capensis TaxID=884348 RepID=UPI0023034EAD|nr:interleukin-9 receptor-like isoform X2 [Hemicordylus capensis]
MEQSRGAAWLLLLLLLLLLQTLLLPSSLAAERQQAGSPGTARCRNSYGSQKRRVDCVWHPNQALGDGPFYLNFSDLLSTESSSLLCKLSASSEMPPVSSCSVTGEGEFMENDQYHVSLHDASLGTEPLYTIFSDYEPMKHIQSDPPFALESSMSASKCRIQWKRPEAYDVLLETVLQWELAFKAADAPWEQAQSKILDHSETWVELEGAEFKSRVSYVARIRCKISDSERHYRSEWSPWSPTTTWTAPPPGDLWPLLGAVLTSLPLCLGGALLLLLLGLRYCARTQGCCCCGKTPTPATFFQPLYAAHRGDFKNWQLHGKAAAAAGDALQAGPGHVVRLTHSTTAGSGQARLPPRPSSAVQKRLDQTKEEDSAWQLHALRGLKHGLGLTTLSTALDGRLLLKLLARAGRAGKQANWPGWRLSSPPPRLTCLVSPTGPLFSSSRSGIEPWG